MMTNRILTIVAIGVLTVSSSGCSGMKGCLFGRGARCGLCNGLSSLNPFSRNAAPPPCAPMVGNVVAPAPYAPVYNQPMVSAPLTCTSGCGGYVDGGYAVGMPSDCGCNGHAGQVYGQPSYDGGYVPDPYLNGSAIPYSNSTPGLYQGDNFQSRRYDSRGDMIISQDPLPPGAVLVP